MRGAGRSLTPAARTAVCVSLVSLALQAACTPGPQQTSFDWPLSCSSFPPSTEALASCARLESDGEYVVRPGVLPEECGSESLHAMMVDGQLLFALSSGKTAPALLYDNGPDYFSEGLARTVRDAKVGFVNERLELVIPREWDFAFPFEDGIARVCVGCAQVLRPSDEHTEIRGGVWGYIDRFGMTVVPVVHSQEELARPARGLQ